MKTIFMSLLFLIGSSLAEIPLVIMDPNGDVSTPIDSVHHITLNSEFDGSYHWYLYPEFADKDTRGTFEWLVDDSIYSTGSGSAYYDSGKPFRTWSFTGADTSIHTVKLRFNDRGNPPIIDSAEVKIKLNFSQGFSDKMYGAWYVTSQGDSVYFQFALNETSQDFLTTTIEDTVNGLVLKVEDSEIREEWSWDEYFCRISVDSVGNTIQDCQFIYALNATPWIYPSSDKSSAHTGVIVQLSDWVGLLSRSRDYIDEWIAIVELEITPKNGQPYRDTIYVEQTQYVSPISEHNIPNYSAEALNASELKYYNLRGQLINSSQMQNMPKGFVIKQLLNSKGEILLSTPQIVR